VTSPKALKPRKSAVQERSRFTVNSILEAAIQVFTEHGYGQTTTNLIAERTGVSVGTLYQYFPNKKAVLIELWERSMKDADEARERIVKSHQWKGLGTDDLMRCIVKAIYLLHKQTVKPQLFFEDLPQPDFIKQRMAEKESQLLGLFAEILGKCPDLRKPDLKVAARMMYEVMERLIHRYLSHFGQELAEEDFIHEAADLLHRYLFAG
jgi:AcrR family transcriptional regulator